MDIGDGIEDSTCEQTSASKIDVCEEITTDNNGNHVELHGVKGVFNITDNCIEFQVFSKLDEKVFNKILTIVLINSWIIYNEDTNIKLSLTEFLHPLENIILEASKRIAKQRRCRGGRFSKSSKIDLSNIEDHLPVNHGNRRRCVRCTSFGFG